MQPMFTPVARLCRWLRPPAFAHDEAKTRQASLVNAMGLACLAFTLSVMAGAFFAGTLSTSTLTIDLIAFAATLQLLRWLRVGKVARARWCMVLFGLVYITAATASIGTVSTPTAAVFTFWVLMTGLLFERRGTVVATVAASLSVLGLILAENAAWLPPPPDYSVGVTQWVTFTALFAFTSGLTWHINQGAGRLLQRAQTEVAQRKLAQEQLHVVNSNLRSLIDALPDLLFEVDSEGVIHDYHSPRKELLLAPPEAFIGRKFTDFLPAQAALMVTGVLQDAARAGVSNGACYAIDLPQGTHWFELSVARHAGSDAQGMRFVCLARDITQRQRAEEALRLSELRHRVLADNARDVLWNMTPDGAFTFISPSVEMVRGYSAAEALRQSMEQCLTPASHAVWHSEFAKLHADWQHGEAPQSVRVELEYLCKDGSTLWSEVMAHPLFSDKGLAEIVGVTRDIAEHKRMLQQLQEAHDATEQVNQALLRANAELARMATTDPLTGIWNRRHFVEVADSRREQARRYQEPLSMLMFDIDHFKRINDSWGHPTGDRVLMELATLVGNSLRQGDAFARWGGEEFVLITAHIGAADAMLLAEKLRDRVASHGFAEVGTVTISLGVAEFALEESLDAWFKRVDLALYAAKSDGRNLARLAPPKLAEALRCEAALLAG